MFYMYILKSDKTGRYYIGMSGDLEKRVSRHNEGGVKYTKRDKPWKLVYCESFKSKLAALNREKELKRKKSKKYLEYLVNE